VNALADALSSYRPRTEAEAADTRRVLELVTTVDDPWSRSIPLHVTASALIVHPSSQRVLLRWHARMRQWLQVGGHADTGESDPLAIALREGREETGLADLAAWPGVGIVHVAVVPVPANGDEPEHEHADLRYVLATGTPDRARPEHAHTPIRWLTKSEALAATAQDNVRETLARTYELIAGGPA
jgi:8-oxo-dGTP pyrophosphatase MutT (NUDIX family)